ncbi:Tau glutathione S-transferase [Rhynchospora pubera]|uniref:glutathione transferase n=1 Tax=Rhynchospora pubera TaxID=906938 RepID=A0AAV8BSU8_9POAL|nr:Tau glutathione S-transferase [Rhynchospora pubera]
MTSSNGPVLLDFWVSPFGQRVRITMAEKGIENEYKEEDLFNKSELLLKSNPLHKKVPVLFHDGKIICELRLAFWADFSSKTYECGTRLWKLKGEKHEAAKTEMIQMLKLFEAELGDKKYFGGDTFGFVDVAFVPFTS